MVKPPGSGESLEKIGPVEFRIEYMDAKSSLNPTHIENLRQFLAHKYRSIKLDVIAVTDNDAFDFTQGNRDKLFPRVPVVFA